MGKIYTFNDKFSGGFHNGLAVLAFKIGDDDFECTVRYNGFIQDDKAKNGFIYRELNEAMNRAIKTRQERSSLTCRNATTEPIGEAQSAQPQGQHDSADMPVRQE